MSRLAIRSLVRNVGLLASSLAVFAACAQAAPSPTSAPAQSAAPSAPTQSSAETKPAALETVNFTMSTSSGSASWFPFYVAHDRGYYRDEGIEFNIQYGQGSGSVVQQMISNNIDYAEITPAATMQGVAKGFPLKYVYTHYYWNRFHIVVLDESPIKSMADLKGKVLGVTDMAGGEMPTVRASLADSGLKEGQDVKIIVIGEGDPSTLQALRNGTADAWAAAKPDFVRMENQGAKLRRITPEPVASFPGDGIVVREDTLQNDRDTVVKLVRATIKGWLWAKANPDAAYQIVKTKYAQAQLENDTFGIPFYEDTMGDTTGPENVKPHGVAVPEAWKTYMDFLTQGTGVERVLEQPVDVDKILANDVVEEAWQSIDQQAIEQAAKEYKP